MAADNITMMLAKTVEGEDSSDSSVEEGDIVDALVLDIDYENTVLDVTLNSSLVSKVKKNQDSHSVSKKKSKKRKKKGEL